MLQPINYSLNVKTPFEAAVEGYKVGLAGQEALAQREALEAQRAKALAEVEKARAEATRMANYQALVQKIRVKSNLTPQDLFDLNASAPESERGNAKAIFDMMTDAQKQDRLKIGGQVLSALDAKRPDVAIARLEESLSAFQRVGDELNAKDTQKLIDDIKANPAGAKIILGATMAGIPEFKDILEASLKSEKRYVVAGDKIYLLDDIEAAVVAAAKTGSQTVKIPVAIPPRAVELLKKRGDRRAFDKQFGVGAADSILGAKN
jgi:hypothetical protein